MCLTPDNSAWLATLGRGDAVAIKLGGFHPSWVIARVERTTPTQIILTDGRKFRRSDGRLIGSDAWTVRYLEPVSDEILATNRRRSVEAAVQRVSWRDLADDKLFAVYEIVK